MRSHRSEIGGNSSEQQERLFPVAIVKCRRADASGRGCLPDIFFHWGCGVNGDMATVYVLRLEGGITEALKIIEWWSGGISLRSGVVWCGGCGCADGGA